MNLATVICIGDEQLLTKAIRCLGLLLIYTKVKKTDGDIPFLMTFVPVSNFNYHFDQFNLLFVE